MNLIDGNLDGMILLWQRTEEPRAATFGGEEDDDGQKEVWFISSILRYFRVIYRLIDNSGSADIYDLAWSPCGKYILAGAIDNSARVWDIAQRALINYCTQALINSDRQSCCHPQ